MAEPEKPRLPLNPDATVKVPVFRPASSGEGNPRERVDTLKDGTHVYEAKKPVQKPPSTATFNPGPPCNPQLSSQPSSTSGKKDDSMTMLGFNQNLGTNNDPNESQAAPGQHAPEQPLEDQPGQGANEQVSQHAPFPTSPPGPIIEPEKVQLDPSNPNEAAAVLPTEVVNRPQPEFSQALWINQGNNRLIRNVSVAVIVGGIGTYLALNWWQFNPF